MVASIPIDNPIDYLYILGLQYRIKYVQYCAIKKWDADYGIGIPDIGLIISSIYAFR